MIPDLIAHQNRAQLRERVKKEAHSPEYVFQLLNAIETMAIQDKHTLFEHSSSGPIKLHFKGQTWQTGLFSTPSLAELESKQTRRSQAKFRFHIMSGADPLTDIGSLQAFAAPHTLFQMASQFNTLESPGPYITPITRYLSDPTQGPRAAISAFAGTFSRHYAAIDKDPSQSFTQSEQHEINLLSDAIPISQIAQIKGGYLLAEYIYDAPALAKQLKQNFSRIRVGFQSQVQVGLGHNWVGKVSQPTLINQVMSSTLAGGAYSPGIDLNLGPWKEICLSLLKASYYGTLLLAILAKDKYVVLTPIGGGVFDNPHGLIWEALFWALDKAEPFLEEPIDIALNAYHFKLDDGLCSKALETREGERLLF